MAAHVLPLPSASFRLPHDSAGPGEDGVKWKSASCAGNPGGKGKGERGKGKERAVAEPEMQCRLPRRWTCSTGGGAPAHDGAAARRVLHGRLTSHSLPDLRAHTCARTPSHAQMHLDSRREKGVPRASGMPPPRVGPRPTDRAGLANPLRAVHSGGRGQQGSAGFGAGHVA